MPNSEREPTLCKASRPLPTSPATVWTQDALGRGATQLPTRGSSQGSRYSRLGATRKGEKATAGQAQTPRQGAVTVSKPTNRHTPRRAGGASTHNPESVERLLGVGAGRPGKPHCVESWRSRFSACGARGSHASGSAKERRASQPCSGSCSTPRIQTNRLRWCWSTAVASSIGPRTHRADL